MINTVKGTGSHTPYEQPQVQIKAEDNANKRDRLFKRETSCPRPQAGNGANFVYASGQSLLNGRLAIATAATPDLCHLACRYERPQRIAPSGWVKGRSKLCSLVYSL